MFTVISKKHLSQRIQAEVRAKEEEERRKQEEEEEERRRAEEEATRIYEDLPLLPKHYASLSSIETETEVRGLTVKNQRPLVRRMSAEAYSSLRELRSTWCSVPHALVPQAPRLQGTRNFY